MQNDVVEAIRHGDVHALEQFLLANPAAVTARVDGQRTLLHVATDWPGHFPNVRQTIELLAAQGAELNAPFHGNHSETPLHWASSSDDLVALDALLDLGADIESPGSVIDGGTPLAGAVVFSQWRAARRLIERGARATIWQSAALGMMDRLQQYVTRDPKPSADEITNAFWNACHGGQLEAARYLLCHNAELNWVGHGGLTPLDAAARNGSQGLLEWLRKQEAASSKELE
jgi:ankyrin repeat protein